MSSHQPRPFVIPAADTIAVGPRPTLAFRLIRQLLVKPMVHTLFRVRVQGRELLPAGAPVVPIAISGARTLWLRKQIDVTVGAPITTAGKSVDEVVAEGHAAVAAMLHPENQTGGLQLLRKQLTGKGAPSAATRATLEGSAIS